MVLLLRDNIVSYAWTFIIQLPATPLPYISATTGSETTSSFRMHHFSRLCALRHPVPSAWNTLPPAAAWWASARSLQHLTQPRLLRMLSSLGVLCTLLSCPQPQKMTKLQALTLGSISPDCRHMNSGNTACILVSPMPGT